ncbi:protein of unknown function DUF1830 [Thalassoporum mexicanum PCC 7367]|nr:protein of unknown function DUF1830 [Pseudanabaena sp. PCC 7367]
MVMSQLLDPVPAGNQKIVCCYTNTTSKIQVVRITNVPDWYFERVAFPGQHLIFEALPSGQLEIHTGMMASSILSDTIACVQLQVENDSTTLPEWLPLKTSTGAAQETEQFKTEVAN